MDEGRETADLGSSFRQVLNILPAGKRTEREIRELSGLFRPLGLALRKGTGAAMDRVGLQTQLYIGNPKVVGISQTN